MKTKYKYIWILKKHTDPTQRYYKICNINGGYLGYAMRVKYKKVYSFFPSPSISIQYHALVEIAELIAEANKEYEANK